MNGLCAVSQDLDSLMVALPFKNEGKSSVIIHSNTCKANDGTFRWFQLAHQIVKPHRRPLGAIAINRNGKLVATVPFKAKKVKIFSTLDGSLVLKVSRGTTSSLIKHMCFSTNSEMLSLTSSDK